MTTPADGPGGGKTDKIVAAVSSTLEMRATEVVCNCHVVNKGTILSAIRKNGLRTREGVAAATKASTGCGSCGPLVESLLRNVYSEEAPRERAPKAPANNKVELWKAEKDGLDVGDDIPRFAKEGWEKIPEGDVERLKWHGIFLRKNTPGFFMLRIRIPGGKSSALQVRAIAELSRRYGRGTADITTRQQIQLRWLAIEDIPEVLDKLKSVGLTSLQTGMDNLRNFVGCPVSGLTSDETLDASPVVEALNQAICGSREFTNLPRKFNVTITGCRANCTHAETQDIALVPALGGRGPEPVAGFNVLVGGKGGSGGFEVARPLNCFVTPEEAVEACLGIIRLYRDFGPRDSRGKARLYFLLEEWGIERFRRELEVHLERSLAPAGEDQREGTKTDHVGLFRQKEGGLNYIGLSVPVGRISADYLTEASRLAESYGRGEIRFTIGQNIIIPHIPDGRIADLTSEPLLQVLRYDPPPMLHNMVSCTGIDYCNLATIETKSRAMELSTHLTKALATNRPLSIHWSGCPAGCGNHQVADIGFLGTRTKIEGEVVEAVHIFIGGRSGPNAEPGRMIMENVPCSELPKAVESLARFFPKEKVRKKRAP